MPHARGGLVPILSWNAKSIRKGSRIKQKQGAHDAVSSDLVSLSLPQNEWRSSRKMSGERSSYWIIPRDQIPCREWPSNIPLRKTLIFCLKVFYHKGER